MDKTADISPTDTPMDSETEIIQLVSDCLQEADYAREPYIARAELNNQQHLGDYGETVPASPYYVKKGHSSFVLNKTLNSDVAHTQAQLEQKPRVNITPREGGKTALQRYMSREALMTVQGLMQQGHVADGSNALAELEQAAAEQVDPTLAAQPVELEEDGFDFGVLSDERYAKADAFPISEAFFNRVSALAAPWLSALTQQPMNPVIKPDDITIVNDALVAEVVQNNCNILWDLADTDAWLAEAVYNTTIVGWNFALYEWDTEKGHDVLTNVHPKHVWLPPEATGVKRSEYAILREPMSKRAACIRFKDEPEIVEAIKAYATTSKIGSDGMTMRATRGGPYDETEMKRAFIDVWYYYLRGHPYPMPAQQAVDLERVEVVGDGQYVLAETGEPTDPEAKNWPTCKGVRVYVVVADRIAEDYECPHADINLLLNKSVPIPFRWVGQGQPERLEWLSRLINRTMSTIYDILKYSRSPQELRPSDVHEVLEGQGGDVMYSRPNRVMWIDAQVYNKYLPILAKGNGFLLEAPKLPEGIVDFVRVLLQMHDEISGNTGVSQGRAQYSGQSGKSIELLQTAARGIMGFESMQTEAMLREMIEMRIHAMCKRGWLTSKLWEKWNSKYPKTVLEAVRNEAANMYFNVGVELASGGGQIRQAEQAQTREDYQAGLVDQETALERLDYPNVEEIMQRVAARNAMQQPLAAA